MVTPLLSEYDLYQESTHMRHCVIGYGPDCASGSSRIFSITKDGRHLATVELNNRTGRWKAVQVRGRHNHPVDEEIDTIAQDLAKRYQKAAAQHSNEYRLTDEHSNDLPEQRDEADRADNAPPPPHPRNTPTPMRTNTTTACRSEKGAPTHAEVQKAVQETPLQAEPPGQERPEVRETHLRPNQHRTPSRQHRPRPRHGPDVPLPEMSKPNTPRSHQ